MSKPPCAKFNDMTCAVILSKQRNATTSRADEDIDWDQRIELQWVDQRKVPVTKSNILCSSFRQKPGSGREPGTLYRRNCLPTQQIGAPMAGSGLRQTLSVNGARDMRERQQNTNPTLREMNKIVAADSSIIRIIDRNPPSEDVCNRLQSHFVYNRT